MKKEKKIVVKNSKGYIIVFVLWLQWL